MEVNKSTDYNHKGKLHYTNAPDFKFSYRIELKDLGQIFISFGLNKIERKNNTRKFQTIRNTNISDSSVNFEIFLHFWDLQGNIFYGVQEAAGSNPVTRTKGVFIKDTLFFFYL